MYNMLLIKDYYLLKYWKIKRKKKIVFEIFLERIRDTLLRNKIKSKISLIIINVIIVEIQKSFCIHKH